MGGFHGGHSGGHGGGFHGGHSSHSSSYHSSHSSHHSHSSYHSTHVYVSGSSIDSGYGATPSKPMSYKQKLGVGIVLLFVPDADSESCNGFAGRNYYLCRCDSCAESGNGRFEAAISL